MKKIAVTGASGFVGKQLVGTLIESKRYSVLSLSRRPSDIVNIEEVLVDLSGTLNDIDLNGVNVLVHCAAKVTSVKSEDDKNYSDSNTALTINLAKKAVESGVSRFIFISSIKVNGERTSKNDTFSVDSPLSPQDAYGRSKANAEIALLKLAEDTGLEVVIIRPPLVYGPGVKGNFSSLMKLVSKGIPLPFYLVNSNRRSLVSVYNLVDLIITCVDHPCASNKTFLVSDDHDVSTSRMIHEIGKSLGKSNWQLPVPIWAYRFLGILLNKKEVIDRLTGSLAVDIEYTKKTLEWHPPQTLQEGFNKTADSFLLSRKREGGK